MKVELIALTDLDINKGYKFNKIYSVDTIEIIGDSTGYDIFYKVRDEYFHDMTVKQLSSCREEDEILYHINKVTELEDIKFNFKYIINLQ